MSSSSSSSFPILVPSPSANGSRHDAPDPAAVAVLPAIPGALAFGEGGERGGDNVDALSRVRDLEDWMSAEATKLLGEPYTVSPAGVTSCQFAFLSGRLGRFSRQPATGQVAAAGVAAAVAVVAVASVAARGSRVAGRVAPPLILAGGRRE